jgi:SAM-dependent methyltransferase
MSKNSSSKIANFIIRLLGDSSWASRNLALIHYFGSVIEIQSPSPTIGIDIGAGDGLLAGQIQKRNKIQIVAFDPFPFYDINAEKVDFVKGWSHLAPFADESADIVLMASVYEHIDPKLREKTLAEIFRILKPNGTLIGEMPNMYFPIEIHSQLPLQQFFPQPFSDAYFRAFSSQIWRSGHQDWFRVSPRQLLADAKRVGFQSSFIKGFQYPSECIPKSLRFMGVFLKLFPLVYVFSIKKGDCNASV